jgi:hypothetical protein
MRSPHGSPLRGRYGLVVPPRRLCELTAYARLEQRYVALLPVEDPALRAAAAPTAPGHRLGPAHLDLSLHRARDSG